MRKAASKAKLLTEMECWNVPGHYSDSDFNRGEFKSPNSTNITFEVNPHTFSIIYIKRYENSSIKQFIPMKINISEFSFEKSPSVISIYPVYVMQYAINTKITLRNICERFVSSLSEFMVVMLTISCRNIYSVGNGEAQHDSIMATKLAYRAIRVSINVTIIMGRTANGAIYIPNNHLCDNR